MTAKSDLTHEDVARILAIVDASENLDEVELDFAGLRLHVRRGGAESAPRAPRSAVPPRATAASATATVAPRPAPAAQPAPKGSLAVKAPMLGTFYRAPAPGEKPFVEVGSRVAAGDVVCLIEVMKLFNSITAGVEGTVVAIAAENGTLVEFEQPLVWIRPSVA